MISGSNADLGIKRADFTYQYSVTDPDGDTVNVVEKIDGKTIATKNAITLGATQTLSVSGNTFTALTNAQHTITITATDSAGNSAVRTLTFTKSIAGFVITLTSALEANSQPTRANIKVREIFRRAARSRLKRRTIRLTLPPFGRIARTRLFKALHTFSQIRSTRRHSTE